MAKEIQARRSRAQTPDINRQPTQQTKLVPRQVPEVRSSTAGLEGLNAAFANFFGQAAGAMDNVSQAVAMAERQRILRENETQKAQAVGDALSGRPMDPAGTNDYDYYDTYRSVLAEKTGVDAVRDFNEWYQTDFLAKTPDGDLDAARQEWAKTNLAGSDDPEFEGMALGTFFKSTEKLVSDHREARTKALFQQGAQNLHAVIDNDVRQGNITPERIASHINAMRTLDPLNATEAAPRVAAALSVAIQNHPGQSEAVLKTISMPGTGINGKSFAESFPDAYAKLQESAVKSWEQTNTFEEMQAVEGLRSRAVKLDRASEDELIQFHADLLKTRNTYGAANDIQALEGVYAKELERRADEYANLANVKGMLMGVNDMDVSVLQKHLPTYMSKAMGIDNILQADPQQVAEVLARSKGVVASDHQAQLSGALMSFENPALQAKAVSVLVALEGARNREYVKKWLDEPSERLYEQVANEMMLTGEGADAALLRAAERRRNGKPFESWVTAYPDKTPADANAHVRKKIADGVSEAFAGKGFLGTSWFRNSVSIPSDVYDKIESYAKSVVIERGVQGVDPDAAIGEAIKRTVSRGEVLPQNGKYVLTFDTNRNPTYWDGGREVPRIRLGFDVQNPATGETVNTLGVYTRQLDQLGKTLPQLLRKGSTDDVSLTDYPLASGVGAYAISQNGTPIVFEPGTEINLGDRKITIGDDEASVQQFTGLMPEGFGMIKVPVGFNSNGWMLVYRANFGDEGGVTLDQRERDWVPPKPRAAGRARPRLLTDKD